jgi:hypothetical protein
MKTPLFRVPWFVGAPAFVVALLIGAFATNYLGADYFKRTRLDEANPLAGVAAAAAEGDGTPSLPAATPPSAAATGPSAGNQPAGGPQLLAQGEFRDGAPGHRGSGKANLGRDAAGDLVLVLENFSVTNGPDLRVILSPDPEGGGDGLDLGKLKATDGTFSYAIPDGTDLTPYRSVTIFCVAFPTVFAYATLGAAQ